MKGNGDYFTVPYLSSQFLCRLHVYVDVYLFKTLVRFKFVI
jgi:hypothetical protein